MHLSLLMIMSLAAFGYASINDSTCDRFSSNNQLYITCKGNFTEMNKLKLFLRGVSESINAFKLQDVTLDVLPPDIFHDVAKPKVQAVIFDNVSMELLEVPELGDHPLKSIRDTVNSLEIYHAPKVFAWDLPSLGFEKLEKIIIEDSELISITAPFFFWPELRFIQIQNCSVRWINFVAFQGCKNLTILSLAHNKISHLFRSMFPKPAIHLYSLDLSFNRVEAFPQNLFSEMEALQELKLDNNHLKILDQNDLKHVWSNLKMLWLDGNELKCESLCWMFERRKMPLFLESSDCKASNKFVLINEYFENCTAQNTSATF